jgi:hypothetical protein
MKRREFIILLGSAAAWPVVSKAQQAERVRLIGLLSILGPDDQEAHGRHRAIRGSSICSAVPWGRAYAGGRARHR